MQRCLEKTPEQRFHSASDLAFALEALSDSGSAPTGVFAAPIAQRSWPWIIGAGCVLALLLGTAAWFAWPPAAATVESIVQLTNDGQSKSGQMEADGSRIYFNEGTAGSFRIAQVSIHGGQTAEVATTLLNPQIYGLMSDDSALLLMSGAFVAERQPMWLLPLPAGEARKLGDTDVVSARIFPDGHILYLSETETFVAEKDGSHPRKLDELSKYRATPRISPDGKRLAFHADDSTAHAWVLYEADGAGTGVHPVLKWIQGLPPEICCMRWTEDGKYLVFLGTMEGRSDLWALPDQERILSRRSVPMRLTNGPLSYSSFAVSRDGKQIFAVGAQRRGELVRYDGKTHEFLPYMGGIAAADPTFSRDGKWMAYMSYPEHMLWRSRSDGSDRLQLTYSARVVFPRISPDGSKVAFSDSDGVIYLVDANGGTPRKFVDRGVAPDWSPDGNLLTFST